ncbi:MFS-type transporter SLC18B1-like isoform X1 [Asterias rubens]|uniref:MFS-type transporter SLC18B1-like isoform X1 n=2 Tax=Asterias rubens TaxID=7604 RepID=UPI001455B2BC|nr:MFS-type transporter SLC18B1-like isoform X1 [Asterias rubens]
MDRSESDCVGCCSRLESLKDENKMENGSANQTEESSLILATSSPVTHSKSQSANSIKETSLPKTDDKNAQETNCQWNEPQVEGPPTSRDSYQNNADIVEDPVGNERKKKPKITFDQKLILFAITIASIANFMSFSILVVFFPIEAKAKGMSQTVIGLVSTIYALSSSVFSPIFGKFLPLIGARFMFLAGSFMAGGSNILFGLLGDMPTDTSFTVYCFLLRIVEGLGAAASLTSSSAILAHTFPDNVGTVVSINEMMIGIGFAVGPALGGLLYNAGGFGLPFYVLGGFDLLIVALNLFTMPQPGCKTEEMGSLKQVLTIPAIWLLLIVSTLGSVAVGVIDPTLSLHLKELHFDVVEISLIFTVFGAVYGLTSFVWGYIADKMKSTRIMLALGAFGCAIFFLFIGPSPLLNITPQKYLASIAIALGASSIALFVIPTLVDMFITAEWYGLSQGLGDTSVISGLWVSAFAIGTMLGPLLGGVLTDHLGFDNAGTVLAGVYIATMLVICFFGLWEFRCGKGRRVPPTRLHVDVESETVLLTS